MKNVINVDKNKVLIAMANCNLSPSELCIQSNISQGTFQRVISQNKGASPKTIGKLAHALNCKVEDLI